MILVIGEILFDVFEKEKQLGGAPFNFAYHLKNLGFPVRYISRIGNDTHGKEILNMLKRHHFNIDDIQIDDNHDTGIYSWDVLYRLGKDHEEIWANYLKRMKEAGHDRPEPKHLQ